MQRSASKMRGRGRSIRKKPSNCSGIRVSLPLHQRVCDVCHNLGDSRRNDPRPLRLISPLRMMTPRHVRFEIQTATEPDKQKEKKKKHRKRENKNGHTNRQTDRRNNTDKQTERKTQTYRQRRKTQTNRQREKHKQTGKQTKQTERKT